MQNHAQRSDALDYIFAKRPLRSVGKEMERPMTALENRAVTVLVTKEHVRRMIEYHLLKEDEISDPVKLSRVVRKSLDTALGLPDLPWHDWDEWGKGLT
jgi:hypothetical protein